MPHQTRLALLLISISVAITGAQLREVGAVPDLLIEAPSAFAAALEPVESAWVTRGIAVRRVEERPLSTRRVPARLSASTPRGGGVIASVRMIAEPPRFQAGRLANVAI